jgi:hypothetical protein
MEANPPARPPITVNTNNVTGKFVKVVVKGMQKAGQYRGKGKLQITPAGLAITGSHVYTLGQRWLFGMALWIGGLLLTAGRFAPGFLVIYLVVEYQWLKNGNQRVSFNRIKAYTAVPEKNLVAIHFIGTEFETPVVMKSEKWRTIYEALESHVPRARRELKA